MSSREDAPVRGHSFHRLIKSQWPTPYKPTCERNYWYDAHLHSRMTTESEILVPDVRPNRRQLRVRKRSRPDNGFVRLSPSVVLDLIRQPQVSLLLLPPLEKEELPDADVWTIQNDLVTTSPSCRSGVEFLPLRIEVVDRGKILFGSYNGGDVNESEALSKG